MMIEVIDGRNVCRGHPHHLKKLLIFVLPSIMGQFENGGEAMGTDIEAKGFVIS